jgi:hypothetical protein
MFTSEAIQKLLEDAKHGRGRAAHKIWILLILELWLREYSDYLDKD